MENAEQLLQSLMARYREVRDGLSQKELAQLEDEMWKLCLVTGYRKGDQGRRHWMREQFGGGSHSYETRACLLAAGDWTDPLWRYLDSGAISQAAARDLYRDAKSRETVEARRRRLLRLLKARFSASVIEEGNGFPVKMKRYLSAVEGLTKGLLDDISGTLEPRAATEIQRDFMETLRLVCADLREEVRKARERHAKPKDRIGKVRFDRACEVLSLSYMYGKPIDMTAVKRRKWQRTKELHPDRNKGSREHELELQAVLDAFDILQQYTDQQSEDTNA
jgi:hypothetical protein